MVEISTSVLLDELRQANLTNVAAFATLNYECLFELAIQKSFEDGGILVPKGTIILNPHGGSNIIVPPEMMLFDNCTFVGPDVYEGHVQERDPREVLAWYESGRTAMPPAMSLYAPGKPTPVAQSFVEVTRRTWAHLVSRAKVVVIIGARPHLADKHVWRPLLETSACVLYIGGQKDPDYFKFKRKLGRRLVAVGKRFEEDAISRIVDEVQHHLAEEQHP